MIRWLTIQRFAVIDALEVEFDAGFNVLTGETGAGKSIVVEALALLVGGRASPDLVRSGEDTAVVQALFETADGREIAVRREIASQGRSRAFIDGSLATTSVLKELTADLVDIHGQHEHQALLDSRNHLDLVDKYGALLPQRASVAAAFAALSAVQREIGCLELDEHQRSAQLALLTFQVGEIDRAAPRLGEDEELDTTKQVLANADKLHRLCAESYGLVYEGEHAVLANLATLWRRMGELAALDARFMPYLETRDSIKSQLEDLAYFLREYMSGLDASPGTLQRVEDRLALIGRLKKKYGPLLSDVVRRQGELRQRLGELQCLDTRAAGLNAELERARAVYLDAAAELGRQRRAVAVHLARALESQLAELAMESTRCEVRFGDGVLPEAKWSDRGVDEAELYLAPNIGEDPRPLARIASGGELSRIMLALKSIASTDGQDKTLVFDEVDSGIGGRVADVVGSRLLGLASRCQVVCITHLPQIAAYATSHFHVSKRYRANRTATGIKKLNDQGRVDEIARMMAGQEVTQRARASARELLLAGAGEGSEDITKGESEGAKAKGKRDG